MFSSTIGIFSCFVTIIDVFVPGYEEELVILTVIIKTLIIATTVGKQIIVNHEEPRPRNQSLPFEKSWYISIIAVVLRSI